MSNTKAKEAIKKIKIWKSGNQLLSMADIGKARNKHIKGYILSNGTTSNKALIDDIINAIDNFEVTMFTYSTKWRNWIAILDLKTCRFCRKMHGKIFGTNEMIYEVPPVHDNCRCEIKRVKAILDGYATRNGQEGADYWLIKYGVLPEYYLSKDDAKELGWKAHLGNLAEIAQA